jgi:hypothetical protein
VESIYDFRMGRRLGWSAFLREKSRREVISPCPLHEDPIHSDFQPHPIPKCADFPHVGASAIAIAGHTPEPEDPIPIGFPPQSDPIAIGSYRISNTTHTQRFSTPIHIGFPTPPNPEMCGFSARRGVRDSYRGPYARARGPDPYRVSTPIFQHHAHATIFHPNPIR